MTRFDADTSSERRKLFADAITAHRNRGSRFCTIELDYDVDDGADTDADTDAAQSTDGDDATDENGENGNGEAEYGESAPWIQFADTEFNLDVTDEERDRLEGLLADYPEFRIQELEPVGETDRTNVRLSARSDANRLASFADEVFLTVYERDESYRAWVTAV